MVWETCILPSPEKPLQPMHYNSFFWKRTFNARSGERMFYKTHVLHTLLDVRKTCINERTLNMRYSIYTFTMR